MRNLFLVGMVLVVALVGCGRKEMPQADTSKPLQLINFEHQKVINLLQFQFTIVGGVGMVGYQIDRGEIDRHCNCVVLWQRYYEQPTIPKQKGVIMVKNLKLLSHKREFAFRMRAVDSMGNLGAWTAPVRARADEIKR